MTVEWTPEHVVDERRAAELVASQFPDLAGAPVVALATGWDNTVYLVDGVWAFRFPRREMAVPLVRRELAVLPVLAQVLPLPVPRPELIGSPEGDYPWPFWGARLVPGTELANSGLPDDQRAEVAAAVGVFLRALHDPALVGAVGRSLDVDPMRRAEPSVRVPRAQEFLGRLRARGVAYDARDVEALLAAAASVGPSTAVVVVSHGDLHMRHVLVGDSGAATGIIDWGDVCLADPAVDLSVAYGAFSGVARARLLSQYGAVTADQEVRARVLAVMLSAALADYAAAEGRAALLAEALAGLRRAAGD